MKPIEKLEAILETLRSPQGCPWDREQTHQSLKRAFIEECYEVVEAIEEEDDELLCEELGDVLLHIIFHSQIAKEQDRFDFDAVADAIAYKMIARHPHVFEPYPIPGQNTERTEATSIEEVTHRWQELKKKEKSERESALDGVPRTLPALLKAQKIQEHAARVGFDWKKTEGVLEKIQEEMSELQSAIQKKNSQQTEEELGDILFSVVNLARFLKIDAEASLNEAIRKFENRFRLMEKQLRDRGLRLENCSEEQLNTEWETIKKQKP